MTANFTAGVLTTSSWHGLETIGTMTTANDMIRHGEDSLAWPVHVAAEAMFTVNSKVKCYKDAIVGVYADKHAECLGVVGGRYEPTTPEAWRSLVQAAVDAGAKPTGCFSLRDGRLVVATFEVGESNGLKTQFILVDSFDGSYQPTAGHTCIRVVGCNTLSAAMTSDGKAMARLRHTNTPPAKIEALRACIGEAITTGAKTRDLYHATENTKPPLASAEKVFDLLFPVAAADATPNTKTRAENARAAGRIAAAMPINHAGNSLATLWNAATYLVDRTEDGEARKLRGGHKLDSMLLGTRGERVEEILAVIEMVMKDGSIEKMTVSDALSHGADPRTVGAAMLQDMLADAE